MKHLLLLHGAIGSKDQLKSLSETLATSYQVHLFNFSGHGGKELQHEFSIQSFAEEVIKWLEENNLDRVTIFGYSMGGYVAMYIAVHYASVIEKIVTLGTKYHWDEPTAAKEAAMLNPAVIEAKVSKFAAQLQERHDPIDWKIVLQKTAAMLLDMGTNPPLTQSNFSEIKVEVLLLVGDRDKMVSLEETIHVYKLLSAGRLCVLPDTSHPIEQLDVKMVATIIQKLV